MLPGNYMLKLSQSVNDWCRPINS